MSSVSYSTNSAKCYTDTISQQRWTSIKAIYTKFHIKLTCARISSTLREYFMLLRITTAASSCLQLLPLFSYISGDRRQKLSLTHLLTFYSWQPLSPSCDCCLEVRRYITQSFPVHSKTDHAGSRCLSWRPNRSLYCARAEPPPRFLWFVRRWEFAESGAETGRSACWIVVRSSCAPSERLSLFHLFVTFICSIAEFSICRWGTKQTATHQHERRVLIESRAFTNQNHPSQDTSV